MHQDPFTPTFYQKTVDVAALKQQFPGRVFSNITREALSNTDYTIELLKRVTRGRPFAILEYGAYFAQVAADIAKDEYLGPKFNGIVEGTQNGINGSNDGTTPGYRQTASGIDRVVISKSRSNIKNIMDMDIGPAIVRASNQLLLKNGCTPLQHGNKIGVIGLGAIGRGVLKSLNKHGIEPTINDTDLAVMTEFAHRSYAIASQRKQCAPYPVHIG